MKKHTETFKACLSELQTLISMRDYNKLNQSYKKCIDAYDEESAEIAMAQVMQLLNALWSCEANLNTTVLHRTLKPIFEGQVNQTLWRTYTAHTNFVRTLLMFGNHADKAMDQPISQNNTVTEQFLNELLEGSARCWRRTTYFERVGKHLLHDKWDILKSLYELPNSTSTELSKALKVIPDSAFCNAPVQHADMVNLPKDIDIT